MQRSFVPSLTWHSFPSTTVSRVDSIMNYISLHTRYSWAQESKCISLPLHLWSLPGCWVGFCLKKRKTRREKRAQKVERSQYMVLVCRIIYNPSCWGKATLKGIVVSFERWEATVWESCPPNCQSGFFSVFLNRALMIKRMGVAWAVLQVEVTPIALFSRKYIDCNTLEMFSASFSLTNWEHSVALSFYCSPKEMSKKKSMHDFRASTLLLNLKHFISVEIFAMNSMFSQSISSSRTQESKCSIWIFLAYIILWSWRSSIWKLIKPILS